MQTLCGSVERGGGRKIACLKENQAKLSPGCQAAITTVLSKYGAAPVPAAAPASAPVPAAAPATSAAAANVHQACHADIAAVCAGVDKSNGGIGKCLKDNAAKLSPGCQAAIADRKAKMQVLRQQAKAACATDSQTLCGAGAKGHAALQCLREKESQLSAGCREVLASLPKPQHK